MAFCKFVSQYLADTAISLDINFLNDYVPAAPESCLKVYLFGLLKCSNSAAPDNTLENFSKVLGLSQEDVISAFYYWQDQNLVQVLNVDPIEIRYLPVKNAVGIMKKFKVDKYTDFNIQAQEIIEGRMITPNEFSEYYSLIETKHIEPNALIMIIKYCTKTKGADIGYNYILTVANNWINEGIKTAEKVEEKLQQMSLLDSDNALIAKALKSAAALTIEHRQLYSKWKDELKFELGTIIHVAKSLSKFDSKFKYEQLDRKLIKYYELKLNSIIEIDEYETNKTALKTIALNVNKALGLYYEDLENEIDIYILNWINKGYSEVVLQQIANFCFKNNIRTLQGMSTTINKLYKLGITTIKGLDQYIQQVLDVDSEIKEILNTLGQDRKVNNFDRDNYRLWTSAWTFSKDVIVYAASLAAGKNMQYLNSILASWQQSNVKTIEQAKKQNKPKAEIKEAKLMNTRSYSSEELDSLFANLDEIEF